MVQFHGKARWFGVFALAIASALVATAQEPESSPEAWLKTGDARLAHRRYDDALEAYRRARQTEDTDLRVQAGVGATRSLLRAGRYNEAATFSAEVTAKDPDNAATIASQADVLWVTGQFLEAEERYSAALARDPALPAALHGAGRSLAAQGQLTEAIAQVASAAAADPTNPSYWLTLGTIYERQWHYSEAVAAYRKSLALLPARAWDDSARRTRERSDFLASFGANGTRITAGGDDVQEVPIHIKNGRVLVQAKLSGWRVTDFELDTGADAMVLTPFVARGIGIKPTNTVQTAGVGTIFGGVRTVQIARLDRFEIGGLRVERIPAVVKAPTLAAGPGLETEGFSPLALGLSMRIDYRRNVLTIARVLPEKSYDIKLPLRMQRLALVRATVNDAATASFLLDTGGDATALSRHLVDTLKVDTTVRKVPVRVWGTSGWDRSAYLLPFTNLEVAPGHGLKNTSVPVLDLGPISALLGIDVGGIIGNELLSEYEISIDLARHELGLTRR
jgi:tetratricopeptide (TPR) repeat protein